MQSPTVSPTDASTDTSTPTETFTPTESSPPTETPTQGYAPQRVDSQQSAFDELGTRLETAGQTFQEVSTKDDLLAGLSSASDTLKAGASNVDEIASVFKDTAEVSSHAPALQLTSHKLSAMANSLDKTRERFRTGSPEAATALRSFAEHVSDLVLAFRLRESKPTGGATMGASSRAMSANLMKAGWSIRAITDPQLPKKIDTYQGLVLDLHADHELARAAEQLLNIEDPELRDVHGLDNQTKVKKLDHIVRDPELVKLFAELSTDRVVDANQQRAVRMVNAAGASLSKLGVAFMDVGQVPLGPDGPGWGTEPCNPCHEFDICEEGDRQFCTPTKELQFVIQGHTPCTSSFISWAIAALPKGGTLMDIVKELVGEATKTSVFIPCEYTKCVEECCPYPVRQRDCTPDNICEYKWWVWEGGHTGYTKVPGGPFDLDTKLTKAWLNKIKQAADNCSLNCTVNAEC